MPKIVAIKGFEMPESCTECKIQETSLRGRGGCNLVRRFVDEYCKIHAVRKHPDCPLIEVEVME